MNDLSALESYVTMRVLRPHRRSSSSAARTTAELLRDIRILELLADGATTLHMCLELSYSERHIKQLIQDLSGRHRARNRAHLVAIAIRSGLI